jgi:hypothetical protein
MPLVVRSRVAPPERTLVTDTRHQRSLRGLRSAADVAAVLLLLGLAAWAAVYWDEVPALLLFGLLLLALARLALRVAARNAD